MGRGREWPLIGAMLMAATTGCGEPPFDEPARQAVADTIRAESQRMLAVMKTRDPDSVLAFYGRATAYVGDGAIGDWDAIVAGTPARYRSYTRVDCEWKAPLRVDVLTRTSAVVTAVLGCQKADTSGAAWVEEVARTEVLAPSGGRWRIVAVHESGLPGQGQLK